MPLLTLTLVLLLFPLLTQAKTETVWNFRQGIPGTWGVNGCTAEQSPDGFLIYTRAPCSLFRDTNFSTPVDTVQMTFLSANPSTELLFLWHRRDSPPTYMVELPIVFPKSASGMTIAINLQRYHQWDPQTDRVGFNLPKDSAIILQEIRFTRWSPMEKLLAGGKSFWTFDTFRPYTINFLWGPRLGRNPVWQAQLFDKMPPIGWTAGRLFLTIFLAAAAIAILWCWHRQWSTPARGSARRFLGILVLTLWLLFDLRMGLELLSYVRTDWRTFVLRKPEERHFRVFEDFFTISSAAIPILTQNERYGFAGPPGTPFRSIMQYRTYPARPVSPTATEEERRTLRHWLVVFRPDAQISPVGELILDGKTLSPPGIILQKYSKRALLFEVSDPTTPTSKNTKDAEDSK